MKLCAYCKEELYQRKDEKRGDFLKRKYCTKGHYYEHKKILNEEKRQHRDSLEPVRICPSCGKTLIRRKDEKRPDFLKRKYCNIKCSDINRGVVKKEKTIFEDHPRQRLDFDPPEILRRAHMAAPQVPISVVADIVQAIEPMIAANARGRALGPIAAQIRASRAKV